MNVLQTIGGFGAKGGGTSTSTYDLLNAIHGLSPEPHVDLLTPDIIGVDDRLMGHGENWIKCVPNDYKTPLAFSRNLKKYIEQSDYDIYHTNGLWMHVNHVTCSVAKQKGKPCIITPHGMLYPEALARSAWKKWPIRKLWFDQDILEASSLHATCQAELNHIRTFGYKGPIALIGNPVTVPDYTEDLMVGRSRQHSPFLGCKRPKKLGFLGRLHPRKKAEALLYGMSIANDTDSEIYIIGSGDVNYEAFLHNEAKHLSLTDRVHFLGFINGYEKYKMLSQLDALFVPSDMENFGMIVPEALLVGTPVMASLGTPWEALNTEQCGWWTDNSPESIAQVIKTLGSMSEEEHVAMGCRGREYIINTFAANKIATKMMSLYSWINGDREKPDFVDC
jgi:glycosyltransferase involved in cell wall biosynthesis